MPFAGKTREERYANERKFIENLRADPVRYAAFKARSAERRRLKRALDPETKANTYRINAAAQQRAHADPARWPKYAVIRLRHIAKKEGLPFNIDARDIPVPDVCPVFGTPFVMGEGYRDNAGPSVDKIIPALGYVKGNVRVISLKANRLKHDCTSGDELRMVADYIDRCAQETKP